MTRPTDWSSLGYSSDPIPGDHSRVDLIGRQYVGTADSILRAAENLHAGSEGARELEREIYQQRYLIRRPLLQALQAPLPGAVEPFSSFAALSRK